MLAYILEIVKVIFSRKLISAVVAATVVVTSVPCAEPSEPASKMTGMRPEAGSRAGLAPGSRFDGGIARKVISSKHIGGRIMTQREVDDFSIKDIARGTGLSERRLEAIEAGSDDVTRDEIRRLAKFFKVPQRFFIKRWWDSFPLRMRDTLNARGIQRISSVPKGAIPTAVALVLRKSSQGYKVLLAERAPGLYLEGFWTPPGGGRKKKPKLESISRAALRETKEEARIRLSKENILGRLNDALTITGKFLISPVVVLVRKNTLYRKSREAPKGYWLPLDELAKPDVFERLEKERGVKVDPRTRMILGELNDVVKAANRVRSRGFALTLYLVALSPAALLAEPFALSMRDIPPAEMLLGLITFWLLGMMVIIFASDIRAAFSYVIEKIVSLASWGQSQTTRNMRVGTVPIEPSEVFLDAIRPALARKGFNGIKLIAEGDNAYVYKASHRGRDVALRVEKVSGERMTKRRTALGGNIMKWILRNGHPNVERIFGAGSIRFAYKGRTRRTTYHVLEYIDGITILEAKRAGYFREIGFYNTLKIAMRILEGLDFIHRRGLYYGSINSTTNVMVDNSGQAKIIDVMFHKPPLPIQIGYKQRKDVRSAANLIASILCDGVGTHRIDAEAIAQAWFDSPSAKDRESVRQAVSIIERMRGEEPPKSRFLKAARYTAQVLRGSDSSPKLPKIIEELKGIANEAARTSLLAPGTRFQEETSERDFADPLSRSIFIRDENGKLIEEQIGCNGRWLCVDKTEKKGLPNEAFMRVIKSFSIAMKELNRPFDMANLTVVDAGEVGVSQTHTSPIEVMVPRDFLFVDRFKQREIFKDVIARLALPAEGRSLARHCETDEVSRSNPKTGPGQAPQSQTDEASTDKPNTRILYLNIKQTSDTRKSPPVPPWAFYLASAVKKAEASFATINDNLEESRLEEEITGLIKGKDIIALTIYNQTFEAVAETVRIIRRHSNAFIAIGGAMATALPEKVEALIPEVNVVLRGEGEEVFPRVVEALEGLSVETGLSREAIDKLQRIRQGIMVRTNGVFISNNTDSQNFVFNMDRVELDFRLLSKDQLLNGGPLQLNTERGCPYRCTFCGRGQGRVFRGMSAKRMIEHLHNYVRYLEELDIPLNSEARYIWIVDDDFFVDPERAIEFFDTLQKEFEGKLWLNPLQASINSFLLKDKRVINQRLIDAIAVPAVFHSGLPQVDLGTDGFTDEELMRLGKGYSRLTKGYTMDEVDMVTDALSKRDIRNLHYWIMSNQDTSLLDFFMALINVNRLLHKHLLLFDIDSGSNSYVMPYPTTATLRAIQKRGLDLEEGRVSIERTNALPGFGEFDHIFVTDVYPPFILDSKQSEGPQYAATGNRLLRSVKHFNKALFYKLAFAQARWIYYDAMLCFAFMSIVNRQNNLIAQGGELAERAKDEIKRVEEILGGVDRLRRISINLFIKIAMLAEACLEMTPYLTASNDDEFDFKSLSKAQAGYVARVRKLKPKSKLKNEEIEEEMVRLVRMLRCLRLLFLTYPELKGIDKEIKTRLSRFESDGKLSQEIRNQLSELLNPDMERDGELWKSLFPNGSLPKPAAVAPGTCPEQSRRVGGIEERAVSAMRSAA